SALVITFVVLVFRFDFASFDASTSAVVSLCRAAITNAKRRSFISGRNDLRAARHHRAPASRLPPRRCPRAPPSDESGEAECETPRPCAASARGGRRRARSSVAARRPQRTASLLSFRG